MISGVSLARGLAHDRQTKAGPGSASPGSQNSDASKVPCGKLDTTPAKVLYASCPRSLILLMVGAGALHVFPLQPQNFRMKESPGSETWGPASTFGP